MDKFQQARMQHIAGAAGANHGHSSQCFKPEQKCHSHSA